MSWALPGGARLRSHISGTGTPSEQCVQVRKRDEPTCIWTRQKQTIFQEGINKVLKINNSVVLIHFMCLWWFPKDKTFRVDAASILTFSLLLLISHFSYSFLLHFWLISELYTVSLNMHIYLFIYISGCFSFYRGVAQIITPTTCHS